MVREKSHYIHQEWLNTNGICRKTELYRDFQKTKNCSHWCLVMLRSPEANLFYRFINSATTKSATVMHRYTCDVATPNLSEHGSTLSPQKKLLVPVSTGAAVCCAVITAHLMRLKCTFSPGRGEHSCMWTQSHMPQCTCDCVIMPGQSDRHRV